MIFSESTRRAVVGAAALAMMTLAPATAQEISASHLAAARSAIDAIDATEQFDNILLNAATQIKSELIVNNPNLRDRISEMVDNEALELAPRRADLENEVARVYARLFTEQELREIGQFYESAAGKKLLQQGPVATREMMGAADVWSNGIIRDLRQNAFAGMSALQPEGGATANNGAEAAPASPAQ